MQKNLFIYSLLLVNFNANAQTINDSIFHNVIEISGNNVVSNGTDYLFNVSIPKSIKKPVIFVQEEVPLNILPTIYPEFSKLIVITPNWAYYAATSNQNLPEGVICAEPMASSIVYEFNRENHKKLKDSLVIMGDFPKMKFKNVGEQNNKELVFYHAEGFGSICCPKDPKWEIKQKLVQFVSSFERESDLKLGGIFKKMTGKEGEHIL